MVDPTDPKLLDQFAAEYARLRAEGRLADHETTPALPWTFTLARVVAAVAVTLGLVMVVLILSSTWF